MIAARSVRSALAATIMAIVAIASCLPSQKDASASSVQACTLQTTSLYSDIVGSDPDKALAALAIAQKDTVLSQRDEDVVVVFWAFMAQLSRDGVLDDAFFDLDMTGALSRVASRYTSVFEPCSSSGSALSSSTNFQRSDSTESVQQPLSVDWGCVWDEAKDCIKGALLTYLGSKLPDWNEISTAGIALVKFLTTLNDLKESKQLTLDNISAALTSEDRGALLKTLVGGIGIAGVVADVLCATNPICAALIAGSAIVGLASLIYDCGTAIKQVVKDKKCGCFFTICGDNVCECDEPMFCNRDCIDQEDPGTPICMQAPSHPVVCCTCGGPIYVDGGPSFWEVIKDKLGMSYPYFSDPELTEEMVTREVAIQECWKFAATMLDAEDCCGRYGGYSDKGGKENCGL